MSVNGVIALWRAWRTWFNLCKSVIDRRPTSRPPRKWGKIIHNTNPLQTSINNNIKLFKLWKPDSNSEATHVPYESSLSKYIFIIFFTEFQQRFRNNVSIWISAAGLVRVAAAATISPREFSRWAPLTFRNYERRRILLKFRVLSCRSC